MEIQFSNLLKWSMSVLNLSTNDPNMLFEAYQIHANALKLENM